MVRFIFRIMYLEYCSASICLIFDSSVIAATLLSGTANWYGHIWMRWVTPMLWEWTVGADSSDLCFFVSSCWWLTSMCPDDSYIYSTIKYNLFEYMRDHNKRYAFRQPCTDSVGIGHLNDLMDEFLKDNPNATTPELLEYYRRDRQLGFYNNWFMADISFFLSPPGSTFLDIVDRSHIMYTQRTNDLLIQSTLARLFLQPKEIQWFQDFTYQHVTISRRKVESGCPSVGALTRGEGTDISLWRQRSDEFISRFSSACHLHATVRKDDRAFNNSAYYDCIGSKLCTMEILAFENGHYLQKIASHW